MVGAGSWCITRFWVESSMDERRENHVTGRWPRDLTVLWLGVLVIDGRRAIDHATGGWPRDLTVLWLGDRFTNGDRPRDRRMTSRSNGVCGWVSWWSMDGDRQWDRRMTSRSDGFGWVIDGWTTIDHLTGGWPRDLTVFVAGCSGDRRTNDDRLRVRRIT